jgi:RNA polymerase sigma factor (sigma-70 family)
MTTTTFPDAPIGVLVTAATRPEATSTERGRAFGQIVARFQDMAFGAAYAALGDPHLAEDAAQEAFLTAWRELENLREPDAFPGWFQRIVRTHCYRMTRGKRLPSVSLDLIGDAPSGRNSDPAALAERAELSATVRAALSALPAHERQATVLYYLGEYDQRAIADFLGVPVTTVKKRVFSARKRLRERMSPYMEPEEIVRETLTAARPSNDALFARTVELWAAVEGGEAQATATLVAADPALARVGTAEGTTPLHLAARLGHAVIVDTLLKASAEPNARDREERTPLHSLAEGSARIEIAERLLTAGADIDAVDDNGRTPVQVAAQRATPSAEDEADGFAFAEFLLARGARRDLFTAAALDRADDVPTLAESAAVVNRRDAAGATPLHAAARAGFRKVAKALLDAGADVTARDADGWTPLHVAAQPGRSRRLSPNHAVVSLLKERGAAIDIFAAALLGDAEQVASLIGRDLSLRDARDAAGATPLCLAAWQGHAAVVDLLLLKGANPDARDATGRTATSVRWRAADLNTGVVERLIEAGAVPDLRAALALGREDIVDALLIADPSLADAETVTWAIESDYAPNLLERLATFGAPLGPLDAAALGLTDLLRALLSADPEAARRRDMSRNTPLHRAAERGQMDAVRLLLGNQAPTNAIAADGAAPLHRAAANGHRAVAAFLLEHGADPVLANHRGESPLFGACASGDVELVALLIENGASVNAVGAGRATPLHAAAERGDAAVIERLLAYGADPDARNYWGATPLHLASRDGWTEAVRALLGAGAHWTARDNWQRTPLHTAAWYGQSEVAELLLNAGVSADERSGAYSTPLHTAAERGWVAVAEVLVQHGADINAQSDYGRTPLHDAVHGGNLEMALFLIEHGADPGLPNNRKMTPLHWAAASGRADIVRLLLGAGVDRSVRSYKDETPLDLALRHERGEVADLLRGGV